jgi:hypothetical protein
MKTLVTIILSIALNAYAIAQGGWRPTPDNPNKWYWIVKDTTIKGVQVDTFAVCITQATVKYQEFRADSAGQLITQPHRTIIWFSEYFNKEARRGRWSETNKLKDFFLEFDGMPFVGLGLGDIGIAPLVKEQLARHYNVSLSNIAE